MEAIPEKPTPILVVDDDPGLLLSIKSALVSAGLPEPALISDSRQVIGVLREGAFQLVLLDILMPHVSGMEVLEQIKGEYPGTECVIITAVDEVETAVNAMRFGAYDYLVKPIQPEKLIITVRNALEKYNLRLSLSLYERTRAKADLKNPDAFNEMVAVDEAMVRVFHQAENFASADYNLIITGETGVGKEMLARIIHGLSPRSGGPFVAINMAAFSKTLFEDELFGHARGAFTGAQEEHKGFIEEAQGGSLLLDEIAELERDVQGKLLRVIEEKELYRLGSTRVRNVDVRIMCTTNRDILGEVEKGVFRRDLFHRLNVCHIHIPPLRERKADILPLAYHFLRLHAARLGKGISSLSPELEARLREDSFPGNVRELENIIAGSLLVEKGKVLTLGSTSEAIHSSRAAHAGEEAWLPLQEAEKRHIYRILDGVGGNRTRAARILGIGLRTLQRKIKEFEGSRQEERCT